MLSDHKLKCTVEWVGPTYRSAPPATSMRNGQCNKVHAQSFRDSRSAYACTCDFGARKLSQGFIFSIKLQNKPCVEDVDPIQGEDQPMEVELSKFEDI